MRQAGHFCFLPWLDMTKDKFRQGYTRSKADAKRRGIEFEFTFDEWKTWWLDTGKWELRGRKAGCFQMCRKNDMGPYSLGNVYCDTMEANSALPHAGATRPVEWSAKISASLKGRAKSKEHSKALALAMLGKQYSTPAGVFQTSAECEHATGVKRATVMWRCKNNYQGNWSYA
jgi:hypothetical protein